MPGSFIKKILCRYRKSFAAATAIEYSMIAAAIAVAIVVIVFTLGDQLLAIFQEIIAGFST